jgi:hypothetical protein
VNNVYGGLKRCPGKSSMKSPRGPDSMFPFVTCEPSVNRCTIAEERGFMNKAIRTILSLVVSLVLCSAMAMAQAGGNNAEKDQNKEHHSRLAKAAFWRHHKDAEKNAKPTQSTQAPSKQAQAKTARVKPASANPTAGKKDQKQEQHASNVSKPSTKKAPAANKTKPRQAQDPKTASLKQ